MKLKLKEDFCFWNGEYCDYDSKSYTKIEKGEILNVEIIDEPDDFLKNISQLRQWLNEDRITETKKMVTNEQLLVWFNKN